ncbi:hypothetical protein [Acutalibacter muris]|uniref:hypothetical protein n=1 Tax=Acutalibacter muris TaxID=1796620 RepID=UPI001A9A5E08|nr:hypothetical protein [Acutalibacter muris]
MQPPYHLKSNRSIRGTGLDGHPQRIETWVAAIPEVFGERLGLAEISYENVAPKPKNRRRTLREQEEL